MAETNDGAFADDYDVDQRLHARLNASRSNTKDSIVTHHHAASPGLDMENEEAPLLSPIRDREEYGSLDEEAGGEEPPEWFGTAELQGLPWWKKPSIYWLLPPFLLFTIAFGGVIIPKLNLIMDLVCDEYYASQDPDPIGGPVDPGPDRCQNDSVSARSSLFLLYGTLCSGILAAITSPKLGALSDRYGRKRLMILNTTGALFGEVITIFAAKYRETIHINWILLGYALEGLCGSFVLGMALAHSYATDCTPPHRRNVAFGYFHACLFTGIAVGPVVAGYIIKERSKYVGKTDAVLLIFYIALGCHVVFIMFLAFFIPESLSKARQESAREKHLEELERLGPSSDWINQLRSVNLLRPLRILWPTGPGSSPALRWNLILLAATDTIMFGVAMGAMGVIIVYTRRQFNWQELESGRFVSIVNSCRVISLLAILPIVTRLIKGKRSNPKSSKSRNSGSDRFDLSIIRVAIFFDMLGYLGFALAREGRLFIASGSIAAIGGIGSPALGAALTKHVPPDRVGQLLGATGLLHSFARVLGPTIFNGIYSATVSHYRQTVFVCLAVTFGLAFLCSWLVRPHVYLEDLEPDGSPPSRRDSADEIPSH